MKNIEQCSTAQRMSRSRRFLRGTNGNCEEKPSLLMLWSANTSVISFGHISLQLPNKCYISFWPKEGIKSCDIKNEKCLGDWYTTPKVEIEDTGHYPTVALIYGLDVNAIKSWWEKFTDEEPHYDLHTQNCAEVVYKALCQGSDWIKENTGDSTEVKTPKRVFRYVTDGYNKRKKVGCGSLCAHCLSLYPYLGLGFFSRCGYKIVLILLGFLKVIGNAKIRRKKSEKASCQSGQSENSKGDDMVIMDDTGCTDLYKAPEDIPTSGRDQPIVKSDQAEKTESEGDGNSIMDDTGSTDLSKAPEDIPTSGRDQPIVKSDQSEKTESEGDGNSIMDDTGSTDLYKAPEDIPTSGRDQPIVKSDQAAKTESEGDGNSIMDDTESTVLHR